MAASELMRLKIEGVISAAEAVEAKVRSELPGHDGLATAARQVAAAAREAEQVSRRMKRPWSLHRLPALFLAVGIVALLVWTWWRFVHVSTISIALPDRDAEVLRAKIGDKGGVKFRPVIVPGSREGAAMVAAGKVDLAFVQGGIPLASDLARLETPSPEVVL